ncbi:MAG: hypothetical protein ABIH23_05505, partial [bacterium]
MSKYPKPIPDLCLLVCQELGSDGSVMQKSEIARILKKRYRIPYGSVTTGDWCDNLKTSGHSPHHNFLHSVRGSRSGKYVLREAYRLKSNEAEKKPE